MTPTTKEIASVNQPSLSNNHNVYILGAGFGREARLPLISDFMNYMRDADLWLAQEGGPQATRQSERNAIREVLEFRLRASAAAYRVSLNVDNIEDFFSLAAASDSPTLPLAMTKAIAATLDYARNLGPLVLAPTPVNDPTFMVGRLLTKNGDWVAPSSWGEAPFKPMGERDTREWYTCPPDHFYAGVMAGYFMDLRKRAGGHNTIITLNYDTLVEDGLQLLGVPYNYGTGDFKEIPKAPSQESQPRADIRILKLHGSVNWGRRVDDPMRSTEIALFPDYAALRLASMAPVIVPPTWQKGALPQLFTVWNDAVKALRTATRVVIIGYSIPATDTHFKYLLAAGLQDNISLRKVYFVNPALKDDELDCPLKQRVLSVFRREHFEQGVIEFVPKDVRGFLGETTWQKAIRRSFCLTTEPPDQDATWSVHLRASLSGLLSGSHPGSGEQWNG